jgi:hypothetical protein
MCPVGWKRIMSVISLQYSCLLIKVKAKTIKIGRCIAKGPTKYINNFKPYRRGYNHKYVNHSWDKWGQR